MRILLPGLLAIAFLSSCLPRPRHGDREEIGKHYGHRHVGECASWISSFKTGFKYCASPPIEIPPFVDPAAGIPKEEEAPEPDGEVTQAALMERGAKVYGSVCVACHQETGLGLPGVFPPLAGAGGFYGDAKKQAGIIVNGLTGPIEVAGQSFNGAMPAQAQLSDYEVAAVGTYVRNSWGNKDGMVTPDDVKAVRK